MHAASCSSVNGVLFRAMRDNWFTMVLSDRLCMHLADISDIETLRVSWQSLIAKQRQRVGPHDAA